MIYSIGYKDIKSRAKWALECPSVKKKLVDPSEWPLIHDPKKYMVYRKRNERFRSGGYPLDFVRFLVVGRSISIYSSFGISIVLDLD